MPFVFNHSDILRSVLMPPAENRHELSERPNTNCVAVCNSVLQQHYNRYIYLAYKFHRSIIIFEVFTHKINNI